LVERNVVLDGKGRTLGDERRETLQVPVLLLAFLATTGWFHWRREKIGTGALLALILACASLGGCQTDAGPEAQEVRTSLASHPRPARTVVEVTWDTLLRVHSGVRDTTLFSAGSPAADESGFFVLDHYGSRVARFDWAGRLRDYVGGRGSGPGEFMAPRQIDVDGEGVLWVLDGGNARISGFDREGELVDELSLNSISMSPSSFAVRHDGTEFHFMLNREQLVPHVLHRRTGGVVAGPALELGTGLRAVGLALQGVITRTDTLDGWVHALGAGDGILPLRGSDWDGRRWHYPEAVHFPTQNRIRSWSGTASNLTTRLSDPTFAAISVDASERTLYVVFMGSTPNAGRLLERWDLETGRYLDSVLLPKAGYIAVWKDRIVVAASNPEPEILVLRMPWGDETRG
jgi:hypothetical protein